MQKRVKQIMVYLLTGLLILSSLGLSFQHLECNHCDVFSLLKAETQKTAVSDCCAHQSESAKTFAVESEDCACAHDVLLAEQQKGEKTTPPSIHQINAVLYPCVITLFNILRTYFVSGIKHVNPIESCIASGRQILSLNAVLLI